MYLNSFDYFRAVTITIIVVGHCYDISGWQIESFFDRTFANLVSGGTSLFVFISGFLFYHIFYHKFEYRSFIKKKIKNVYLPYIFLSILPICYALYVKMPYEEYFFGPTDSLYDRILRPAFLYFWHGGIMVYWYIPFIITIFLFSPVFIYFIRLKTQYQIVISLILSIVSAFMHRPLHNISIIQSVIYFTPVYMIGILCSMQKEYIYEKLKGKNTYFFVWHCFLPCFRRMSRIYAGIYRRIYLNLMALILRIFKNSFYACCLWYFCTDLSTKTSPCSSKSLPPAFLSIFSMAGSSFSFPNSVTHMPSSGACSCFPLSLSLLLPAPMVLP